MVTIITEQTGASESQARAALLQTQNDLVEALALCGPKTEEQAEQEAMAKEVRIHALTYTHAIYERNEVIGRLTRNCEYFFSRV